MAMKDMALSPDEAREMLGSTIPGSDQEELPKYPWGLSMHLSQEVLEKLAMSGTPPVGAEMMLSAKVIVTGYSRSERQGGEVEECVDIQITAMDLSKSLLSAEERHAKAAGKLYGG